MGKPKLKVLNMTAREIKDIEEAKKNELRRRFYNAFPELLNASLHPRVALAVFKVIDEIGNCKTLAIKETQKVLLELEES